MKRYDFTVVGTAATVSVLRVKQMPECGKSTPVFGGSLLVVLVLTRLRKPICAWLVRLSQRLRHFIDLANEVDDEQ